MQRYANLPPCVRPSTSMMLKAAKIAAIRRGTTLTALVEQALRETVEGTRSTTWEIPAHIDKNDPAAVAEFIAYMESKRHNKGKWKLTTVPGGPLPGLSFDSISELIEKVEGPFARP